MFENGKRYWFCDRQYVYSGLYAGKASQNVNLHCLVRKNGDSWLISEEDIYETKAKAIHERKYMKVIDS